MDPDTLVQEKLDADTGFNESIAALSEEEKTQAIADKRAEITKQVIVEFADKAKKNEELAGNYKTRAEKAEAEAKKLKPGEVQPAPASDALSPKDQFALNKADVHIDDLDEVLEAAKFFGKGDIAKGLQNDAVKSIIAKNAEHRKTAEAANTRPARPAQKEATDEQVLNDTFKNDKIPERGSKEADKLFLARRGKK